METKVPTRSSTRAKASANPPATTTRSTRSKATTKALPPTDNDPPPRKVAPRRPLVNRENSAEVAVPATVKAIPKSHAIPKQASSKALITPSDGERELIMAYLRIRPRLRDTEPANSPYLTPLSETEVRMTDPSSDSQNLASYRISTLPPSSIYTFSHVFPPATTQSDFFAKTTLPLVRDVLQGQNSLLFTYGVTNSGKTYTVQGGTEPGSAGIVPRTLDVIFNSIEGLQSEGKYRPVRLQGVESADISDNAPPAELVTPEPALTRVLGDDIEESLIDTDIDPSALQLDRNYEYSIWLSYAEVYNEKVYDLLDSVKDDMPSGVPRPNTVHPLLLSRKALNLRFSPPTDSDPTETAITGKYISGLRQFRVQSAPQAKALVKLGQIHRRVFGTLANRESSRSHGMVIVKVLRGHRGDRNDPTSLQVSRLTLVDLAGSERTKNTHSSGDRLKEAGSINKSLMVLGQCMEVMRSNQRKLAASLAGGGMDTRDVRKGLAVVPFRHSKLTEVLMDYFIGDGRAVMILNVNPYDTGYDENSHVMKFSALAREVYISPMPAPVQSIPVPTGRAQKLQKDKENGPPALFRRRVTISTGGRGGKKPSETILEVLEDEESSGESNEEGDEPINPLVDALFDEIETLRLKLFESEMRCALIEAEIREEVTREMEERMSAMEKRFTERLTKEVERSDAKTDAKIDMLHQSGLFASPTKPRAFIPPSTITDSDEEMLSVEENISMVTPDNRSLDEISESNYSPLAGKGKELESRSNDLKLLSSSSPNKKGKGKKAPTPQSTSARREIRESVPRGPPAVRLPSDEEDAVTEDESAAGTESAQSYTEEEEVELVSDGGSADSDEWKPPSPAPKSTRTPQKSKGKKLPGPAPRALTPETVKRPARKASSAVSKIQRGIDALSLQKSDIDENSDGEVVEVVKKKKRQLGKKSVMTEDQIELVADKVERQTAKRSTGKNIRRIVS